MPIEAGAGVTVVRSEMKQGIDLTFYALTIPALFCVKEDSSMDRGLLYARCKFLPKAGLQSWFYYST